MVSMKGQQDTQSCQIIPHGSVWRTSEKGAIRDSPLPSGDGFHCKTAQGLPAAPGIGAFGFCHVGGIVYRLRLVLGPRAVEALQV